MTGEGNGLPISPLPSRVGWNICGPASDSPILAYRRLRIVLEKVIPLRELAHGFLSGHAKIPHEQYSLLQSGFLRLFGNIVVVDGLNFFLLKSEIIMSETSFSRVSRNGASMFWRTHSRRVS